MELKELIAAAQACEVSMVNVINGNETIDEEFKELAIEDIDHLATLFRSFLVKLDEEGTSETVWDDACKFLGKYIADETANELGDEADAETIEDIKDFRFSVLDRFVSFFDEIDLAN